MDFVTQFIQRIITNNYMEITVSTFHQLVLPNSFEYKLVRVIRRIGHWCMNNFFFTTRQHCQKECIPVECVSPDCWLYPSMQCAVCLRGVCQGVCLPRGVCPGVSSKGVSAWGVSAWGVSAQGCVPLVPDRVYLSIKWGRHPHPVDRQTTVKT